MMPPSELIRRSREKADAGMLPCERPVRVRGGRSSGATCCVCDRPIDVDVFEYQLWFTSSVWSSKSYSFHFDCHTAWVVACVTPP